jgi:hypothetical protein
VMKSVKADGAKGVCAVKQVRRDKPACCRG